MQNAFKNIVHKVRNKYYLLGLQKIFCIGKAKTGTTSLEKTFKEMGYIVGKQLEAEKLLRYYKTRDFRPLINYCRTAQVFQDHPFGLTDTFKYLDKAFPNSKFILSIRDSPEQWYNSLVNSHARKFGRGSVPTAQQLRNAQYVWKGWVWESMQEQYGVTEEDPYNKEKLISVYIHHNQSVIEYFKDRNDLLVLNISEPGSFTKFCEFIPRSHTRSGKKLDGFPWENKTSDIPL